MADQARDAPLGAARLHRLVLPVDWRAVDFLSDVHLSASMPRTFDAWATHLMHTEADAVFILGDLFDAWVGDDMRGLPFERRCIEVLTAAANRRQIGFMVGNRDFLAGATMREACGLIALPDPTLLDAWGRPVLLTHGDALCIEDTAYQAFRAESRSLPWRQSFLALSLVERMRRVSLVREQSKRKQQEAQVDAAAWADVDADLARSWLVSARAFEMIHGHTHRPGVYDLGDGMTRHVLTDWDMDHELPGRAEVLRVTPQGLFRQAPASTP